MTLYIDNPKDSIKKLLEPINKFSKIKAIQTKSQKEAYTYTLTKREKGKNQYI